MCPGKIERADGSIFRTIGWFEEDSQRTHIDKFCGEPVVVTESFHICGGLNLVTKEGKRHLSPDETIALDSGLIVRTMEETPEAFKQREVKSKEDAKVVTRKLSGLLKLKMF
jgi:hypothetical protein